MDLTSPIKRGKVTSASPLRVKPNDGAVALRASFLVGSAPSLNQSVLWAYVGRQVVVFSFTAV